jgi:carboxyl-terminal processing protease
MKPIQLFAVCAGLVMLATARAGSPSSDSGVSLEDLRAFTDAWGYIREHYVEEIDDRQLFEAALRGMLESLDPHSRWLSDTDFRDLEDQAIGRYGGLGIEVGSFEDHLRIVTVFDDTPAAKAGLSAGDRIVAVDGTDLDAHNLEQASGLLRGPAGTDVTINVSREDRAEPMAVTLTREMIRRESVTSAALGHGIQHVRIRRFQQNTAQELGQLLTDFESDEAGLSGLVLDLRDNPGGMLQSAITVADLFLASQLVVTSRGRDADNPGMYHTGPNKRIPDVPIVVLIDGGSASAAEILAAALRDHGRALLVGETTYGKGSVQSVWPLRNGSGIRLTTALYYTPAGDQIQARGVTPDVFSSPTRRPQSDAPDRRRREADLHGHLPGLDSIPDGADEVAQHDPVLADGMRVLAGISRMQSY